jgi:ferredoxin
MRVRIDQDKCTGDGLCVQYAAAVFEFDIDGLAYVKDSDGELKTEPGASVPVPPALVLEVIDAAEQCPGECIYVERPDGSVIGGPSA